MAKTTTTNFGLGKYADGDTHWGTTVDANFDAIDAALSQAYGVVKPGSNTPNLMPLVVTFQVQNGQAGTNVAGIARAPRAGTVSECVVTVSKSDASGLQFAVKKNGTAIFTSSPVVGANAAANSQVTFTNLTAVPLTVAKGDTFTLDILSGTTNWAFTLQLE